MPHKKSVQLVSIRYLYINVTYSKEVKNRTIINNSKLFLQSANATQLFHTILCSAAKSLHCILAYFRGESVFMM